ncbi:MAG: hypothetical protein V1835_04685, partial [Candidatus Micrarchaeota archaeon]
MPASRRAFIAAPLVGTMIFLVCLLLVASMSRNESSRVNEVVSRAYHNRLASVVEIYRSDLGSNFNTGLQRIIEFGLTSQCWFNFVNLKTERKVVPTGIQTDFEAVASAYSALSITADEAEAAQTAFD